MIRGNDPAESSNGYAPRLAGSKRPVSTSVLPASATSPFWSACNRTAYPDQFSAGLKFELLSQVRAVGLDGLYAEMELVSDLACAQGLAEQSEHFELPIRKVIQGMGRFVRVGCRPFCREHASAFGRSGRRRLPECAGSL